MAFVFTPEDGSGVAGANSYVTVAFADDYFAIDPRFTATWTAFTTQEKQIFLAWATRTLDQKVTWRGEKTDPDNALRWPREGTKDRDGEEIDEDEIPLQLQELVCEFVKYMQGVDPTVTQDIEHIKRMKLDVMEIEYQDGTAQTSAPPIFDQLLVGIGYWPSGVFGFGRIRRA